jgi:hypothetical protein
MSEYFPDLSDIPKRNIKAIRLTFSYKGPEIRLISRQRLEKALPPHTQSVTQPEQAGFWYELADSKQNVVYKRAINNPIRVDTEVFSDDPRQSISRKKLSDISGTFSLVVPDIPDSNFLNLFSSPIIEEGVKGLQKPAKRIFHFNLKED